MVTLEERREFFNHLKVILSERIEIIQFGPNLHERKAEAIATIDSPFTNPNPLPEILKRWSTSPCSSLGDFHDADGPVANPRLLLSLEKQPQRQS